MAATRLIALHVNKGKTVAQCLADRTDYSQNAAKTNDGEFISSYECDPKTADEEFLLSKRQYQHTTGRQQKNDIIAYQSGNMVVVHRIIEVEPDTVITQGDANNAPDAPIRKEMIKGKVVHWIPGAGRIARLLKSPVATVILVGGALLLSELTLRKEKKKDEDELEQIKAEIRRLKMEQ